MADLRIVKQRDVAHIIPDSKKGRKWLERNCTMPIGGQFSVPMDVLDEWLEFARKSRAKLEINE